MVDNIFNVNCKDELKESYTAYAKAVAIDRALPDIRDGLKPVQRRILYSMYKNGNTHDKPYRKSARIVGDVMGKYHPHGDSSIYEAMAKMSEVYSMNIPLIDGQGNFGSVDGDKPAAMRYTEARLQEASEEFLKNLDKNTVEFCPNFDNTLQEPEILPVMLPNLLINGASGIGVGIATNIPTFNSKEILDAAIRIIKNPNVRDSSIYNIIPGPDFPLGGIIDKKNIIKIYKTGNGSFDIYGQIKKEGSSLIITEIPQTLSGNKEMLIDDIIKKVGSGKIPEITSIEDQSSKDIRIVLKVKKSSNMDNVIAKLYQYTMLKSSFTVNMTGVYKNHIQEFNLREYLNIYIEHIKTIQGRFLETELIQKQTRISEVEGLIYALENIKLIIEIVTGSDKISSVRSCLSTGDVGGIKFETREFQEKAKKIRLKDTQIDIILRTRLSSLVGMEKVKLLEEKKLLQQDVQDLNNTLNNADIFNSNLIEKLKQIKNKYGSSRKSTIKDIDIQKVQSVDEAYTAYILIDNLGYVKKLDNASYSRIGEDVINNTDTILEIESNDRLALFTKDGNLYYIEVKDFKKNSAQDRGDVLEKFLDKCSYKDVLYISSEKDLYNEQLLFVSKNGYGKIVGGENFRPQGKAKFKKVKASNLEDGDYILNIYNSKNIEDIELETADRILRFSIDEIPSQGKSARGVYLFNKKYLPLTQARVKDFKTETKSKRALAGQIKEE